MYKPQDIFGQKISRGDIIIYSVKGSIHISTNIAVIDEVMDYGESYTGDRYGRYGLKVRTYDPSYWHQDPDGMYREHQRLYKTTLFSNRTIIKLNNFHLPQGFKDLLLASVS